MPDTVQKGQLARRQDEEARKKRARVKARKKKPDRVKQFQQGHGGD